MYVSMYINPSFTCICNLTIAVVLWTFCPHTLTLIYHRSSRSPPQTSSILARRPRSMVCTSRSPVHEARGITVQKTKFHRIVASLSPEIATEVRDLILTPPTTANQAYYCLWTTTVAATFQRWRARGSQDDPTPTPDAATAGWEGCFYR